MQEQPVANVRWGEWISEGWQMFADKWQVWVMQMLVVGLIFAIPVVPFLLMIFTMVVTTEPNQPPELPPLFFPLTLGTMAFSILIGPFFLGGLHKTAFKQLRGEPISVGDVFSGGDIYWRILGALIATAFFTFLGGLLCFFPAYVVSGLLFFTLPLVVERNLSIGEALSASFNMTKGNWFMFTLFPIVVSLLAGLGGIACYIGVIATFPLHFTIMTIAYRDLFGVAGARNFTGNQTQHPTNYAPQSFPPPQFGAPPQPEQTTSLCTNCGTMLNRASRFCSKCGSPIGS